MGTHNHRFSAVSFQKAQIPLKINNNKLKFCKESHVSDHHFKVFVWKCAYDIDVTNAMAI